MLNAAVACILDGTREATHPIPELNLRESTRNSQQQQDYKTTIILYPTYITEYKSRSHHTTYG